MMAECLQQRLRSLKSVTFSMMILRWHWLASAHISRHSKHSIVHFSKPSSLPFNGAPHYVFLSDVQLLFTTYGIDGEMYDGKADDFWL